MTTPTAHSILAPSAADIWGNCPGYVALKRTLPPRPDTPQSMEGTAAHWVITEIAAGRSPAVGSLAPNGVAVTDEMHEGAELYLDMFLPQHASVFMMEKQIRCPSIHPECWGTTDGSAYSQQTLRVVDYKFGHEYVEEWQNLQLVCYASGELDALQFDWSGAKDDIPLELSIVQPRCYSGEGPVRTWRTSALKIKPLVEKLHTAAERALGPAPTVCAGAHCKFCDAITVCASGQHAVADSIGVGYMAEPSPMTPESMGLMMRRIEMAQLILKSMKNGLAEEMEAMIRAGKSVPGWTLESGRSKIDWTKPVDEVIALGDMFGVDLRKAGVKTPLQASKKLEEVGIDASVISEYSGSSSGSLRLVQIEDGAMSKVFR